MVSRKELDLESHRTKARDAHQNFRSQGQFCYALQTYIVVKRTVLKEYRCEF